MGDPADNQTCQNLCKDEVITWVDTIGECVQVALGNCSLLYCGRHLEASSSVETIDSQGHLVGSRVVLVWS